MPEALLELLIEMARANPKAPATLLRCCFYFVCFCMVFFLGFCGDLFLDCLFVWVLFFGGCFAVFLVDFRSFLFGLEGCLGRANPRAEVLLSDGWLDKTGVLFFFHVVLYWSISLCCCLLLFVLFFLSHVQR